MTVGPDSRLPANDRSGGPDVPGRRAVLRGIAAVGVVGAAGSLAACGGDDVATSTPGTGGSPTQAGTPSAGPSASGSPSPSTAGAAALAAATDVPVGGARIFAERGIVITQPEAGSFKAFSSLCTHQRCPVTEINGDSILCKCHGSAFSITDGAPKTGPATQPLAEVPITVSGGEIRRA